MRSFIGLVSFDGFTLNGEEFILSTINDITKQKEAEESLHESEHRYRSLVQLLPVAMLVHSEGKIVFINDEGIKLLHGSSHADFIGKSILDFVHPDYHDLGRKRINDLYKKRKDAESLEEKFIRLDGVVIDVEVAAKIVNYRGKPASQAVIKDITERKLLAEELQKTQKLESVGILAGGIAHDFNNILTAIMGNISLALLKTDPEQQLYPLLQSAEKASLRARDLTQQLLTFSKGGEPIKENASIEELIRESGEFILRGSNVSCSYFFERGILPVKVDKGQISQVIQNLILNAGQSMPSGGNIQVDAENISLKNRQVALLKKGKYIKISIKDRGIGIEEKLLQKIFDPGAKVVVSSGYSNDPVMANYKKYGFSGVLPKPIVLEDLNKLLTRLSHKKS